MSNLNYTAYISGNQCIGDSRYTINNNFSSLDLAAYQLSAFDNSIIPTLTLVRLNSATWEESSEIMPTVLSYLSTNKISMSSVSMLSSAVILQTVNDGYSGLILSAAAPGGKFTLYHTGNGSGRLRVGSRDCMSLFNTGYIGINTTTPETFLHVGGIDQTVLLDNSGIIASKTAAGSIEDCFTPRDFNDVTNLNFKRALNIRNTAPFLTTRLFITSGGNIGINTNEPTNTLTVAGSISGSGSIYTASSILSSNYNLYELFRRSDQSQLSSLSDVQITLPVQPGQVLMHDGIKWYNDFDLADVTDSIRNDVEITGLGSIWTIVPQAITYNKLSNTTTPLSGNVRSRIARAWLNYDGVNNIIRSSFNISSVTDLGIGYYRVNYLPNTFIDNKYCLVATCDETSSGGIIGYYVWAQPKNPLQNSTEIVNRSYFSGSSEADPETLTVVVFASGN